MVAAGQHGAQSTVHTITYHTTLITLYSVQCTHSYEIRGFQDLCTRLAKLIVIAERYLLHLQQSIVPFGGIGDPRVHGVRNTECNGIPASTAKTARKGPPFPNMALSPTQSKGSTGFAVSGTYQHRLCNGLYLTSSPPLNPLLVP